jgi:ribose/xylose/arabinose/galactoside ABC-type transport system permease subunit
MPGLWGGALFRVLLLAKLNTFGVSAGIRIVVTGLVIIRVIIAAGGQRFDKPNRTRDRMGEIMARRPQRRIWDYATS